MDSTIRIDPVNLIIGLTDQQRKELRNQIQNQISWKYITTTNIPVSFYTIKY